MCKLFHTLPLWTGFAIHPTILTKPFLCSFCRKREHATYCRMSVECHCLLWFPPGKWSKIKLGGRKHQTQCRLRQTLVCLSDNSCPRTWGCLSSGNNGESLEISRDSSLEAINCFQRVLSVLTPRYTQLLPLCSTVYAELPWNETL